MGWPGSRHALPRAERATAPETEARCRSRSALPKANRPGRRGRCQASRRRSLPSAALNERRARRIEALKNLAGGHFFLAGILRARVQPIPTSSPSPDLLTRGRPLKKL